MSKQNLDPNAEARQATRKEWDEIEEQIDEITEIDIARAANAKFKYTNAGSGFCQATDHGKAGKGE